MAVADHRVRRHHREVATQHELQSACHARAVDHGDGDEACVFEPVADGGEVGEEPREGIRISVQVLIRLEIASGGERLARAGDDDDVDLGVGDDVVEGRAELADGRMIERVELVGSIEREHGDVLVALGDDLLQDPTVVHRSTDRIIADPSTSAPLVTATSSCRGAWRAPPRPCTCSTASATVFMP